MNGTGYSRIGQGRDAMVKHLLTGIASMTVLTIVLIIGFIGFNGLGVLSSVSLSEFLFGTEWDPSEGSYGAMGIIIGTLLVTLGAMVFAFPVGLASAIYISEFASPELRRKLKPICEVFAGIPSVVYGFFGLLVLLPILIDMFPNRLLYGSSWLASSILLGIMALPTIISISEDAIHSVPQSFREASLGMGATRWQTTCKVIVPAAISGISAAVTLGIGRAIGETMAVMMVSGNSTVIPDPLWNVFSLISTITGTLALEMPEVEVGSVHYSALFMLGFVLMAMILGVNIIARIVINRTKRRFNGCDLKDGLSHRLFGRSRAIATVSYLWHSNKGALMRFGSMVLVFVAGWMIASLFVGDIASIIIGLVLILIFTVVSRMMERVNPNGRQEVAVCALMINMVLVVSILILILGYVLVRGIPHLSVEFLTQFPTGGGTGGGIFPAIVGTLELLAGTALIAFPFGILTGIYLAEYAKDTKFNRVIREAIGILNGTPSVVFGLFGLTFFVMAMGMGQSLIAGCLVLSLMIVPVIIRTTEEAILTVPMELREASRAMGATKWQTTYKVVLPAAMGGTITGAILAIGRAAGETAPIMFTAVVAYQSELAGSLFEPVMALPYHLYYLSAEVPGATGAQYGTATVLLIIVLGMFIAASLIRNHYNKKIKW